MIKVVQPAAPQGSRSPTRRSAPRNPQPVRRARRLPKMSRSSSRTAIQVFLVEQHTLPLVSMDLNFEAAPSSIRGQGGPRERVHEHALRRHAAARQDPVRGSARGYRVESTRTPPVTRGHLDVEPDQALDTTFALFVETLQSPGFRASDFDRMVKRRIEAVKQSRATRHRSRGASSMSRSTAPSIRTAPSRRRSRSRRSRSTTASSTRRPGSSRATRGCSSSVT